MLDDVVELAKKIENMRRADPPYDSCTFILKAEGWIREAIELTRKRTLEQGILALCPKCGPHHALSNGRIWGFCKARHLVGAFTEKEVIAQMRAKAGEILTT